MGFKRKQKKNNNKYSKSDKEERKAKYEESKKNDLKTKEEIKTETSKSTQKEVEINEYMKKCLKQYEADNNLKNKFYKHFNINPSEGHKFFTREENIKRHYEYKEFFENEFEIAKANEDLYTFCLSIDKIKYFDEKIKMLENNLNSIDFSEFNAQHGIY